ncbi:MAG: VanZ family protein [Ignavibacteria bacterium]|nr:VanZ family protein [Ignavibacteria bacterium]
MIIFIQSSFPAIELPKVEFFSADKIVHMGVYGMLAMLCYISLVHADKQNLITSSPLLWTSIICILYGASDEIHQYFVPNRSSELLDWGADILGVIIAILLIKYLLSNRSILFGKGRQYGT